MITYIRYSLLTRVSLYSCLFFFLPVNIIGQTGKPSKNSGQIHFALPPFRGDTLFRNAVLSKLTTTRAQHTIAKRPSGALAICNTATFYMHLSAPAGQKINLKEIQTLSDGNYLLSGNVTLLNAEQEGLLCIMANSGDIIYQQQVRINNQSTTVFSARPLPDGRVVIAGIVHDATGKVFVSVLNSDLSTSWLKVFNMPDSPVKVALEQVANGRLIFASQSANDIFYALLNGDGSLVWSKQLSPAGLNELVGLCHNNNVSELSLVINCTRGGKKMVEVINAGQDSGDILSAHTIGDGTDERKSGKTTSFSGRFISVGVVKNNLSQFQLVREILFNSATVETSHKYSLPITPDFNTSSAMDNAGDALGFCFPQQGKLVYIRHFAYYQTAPEFTRQYTVPVGSSMAAVTRSLIDGGYLFGVNTVDANEFILIKTDSIGILAGCSYQDITNSFTETIDNQNKISATTASEASIMAIAGTASVAAALLSTRTDCNQNYCPARPADDTCFSSYYKTFKSNSYVDAFGSYHLMRNNKHLVITGRLNRVSGDENQVTYGIKLFDEKGDFIKGVSLFSNGVTAPVFSKQVDDQHVMLVYYSVIGDTPCFTFTLIDDDLQILWTKSVRTFAGYNFNSGGIYGDLTKDTEGNYYYVANNSGIFENAKILAYKMDANGNQVWLKIFEVQAGILLNSSVTTTTSSLIIITEGSAQGSVSVRLDKGSGQLLNAFQYQNSCAGMVYNRFAQFENGRIFYAGNDGQSRFVMGIFDTTGRPVKLKYFNHDGSIMRAATVKSGKLYAMYSYFNGSEFKDVLLKADTALSLEYINEFDPIRFGYPAGMAVGDNGSIYVAGNFSYGGVNGSYYDPFLKKFDPNGLLGTCSYAKSLPVITDIVLNTAPIGSIPFTESFSAVTIPLNFVPDPYGQQIGQLLCSSMPVCNSIKLTGPVSVCRLNQVFNYRAKRNDGCTIKPLWIYDTAFAFLETGTDSTADFKFKKTGSTWLKVSLHAGCNIYTDSLLVQVQNSPISFSLGRDTIICTDDSVLLNAGAGFNTYLWQDGSAADTLIATRAGQYYVRVDNVCGNVFSDTINISPANAPVLNIGRDSSVCYGDTLNINAPAGFSNYVWKAAAIIGGQGQQQVAIVPVQNESITLKATTSEGCNAYDTLAITSIQARPVFLGRDTSFCLFDSVLLSAGTGYLKYTWSNGAAGPVISATKAGTYWVEAKDANGCIAKDTMAVQEVFTLPLAQLGNDFDLCRGELRKLDAGNFNQYLWQDGSVNRYYTVSEPGRYWVKISDIHHCSVTDTIVLRQLLPYPSNFLKPFDSLCQYEQLNIAASAGFSTYLWSTGSTQQGIVVTTPGDYILSVSDANGCTGNDTINIIQKDCLSGLFLPTAFTPNGDASNDVFKAKVYGTLITYRLEIFNRYGEMIFRSTDPQKGWDGLVKGIKQPNGVFVWQCFYQLAGRGRADYEKGTVTLLR